jgi:hypothetical protein
MHLRDFHVVNKLMMIFVHRIWNSHVCFSFFNVRECYFIPAGAGRRTRLSGALYPVGNLKTGLNTFNFVLHVLFLLKNFFLGGGDLRGYPSLRDLSVVWYRLQWTCIIVYVDLNTRFVFPLNLSIIV